jgi:hypothetical protein
VAGVNCSSVRLTQHKTLTQDSKANIMATKKNIKVRDLKPSKDAKGGRGPNVNSTKVNSTKVNSTKVSHHHGPAVN